MLERIVEHLDSVFAGHAVAIERWRLPPAVPRLPDIAVVEVAPLRENGLWMYFSLGAWRVRRERHASEFFLCAPERCEAHVELLSIVAHVHAGLEGGKLAVGHTLPIGRPWLPGSDCDYLFVSSPYVLPDHASNLVVGEQHVEFLWLIPVTAAEARYRHKHGVEALEQRFEDAALEYWNAARRSVV